MRTISRKHSFGPALILLHLTAALVLPCYAQTSKIFQWQFGNNALSESLPSCQEFPIVVKPFDPAVETHGVPPFYMRAFPVGGTPITSLIGESESDLRWTVEHPINSQLMLTVVDSQGSSGGVPPRLYTVVTGQSTQCIKSSDTDFTVTANITDVVTTCQPWGLRIKGGVPPYNLTLAAINSPIITNVTMGGLDDAFTYINRADPDTQLLAAINDFTGRYATGTPIVTTRGSTNVDCIGLVSSSGNSAKLQQDAENAASAVAAASRQRTTTAVAVSVTIVLLLLIGGGIFAYWYIRKRKAQRSDQEKMQIDPSFIDNSSPASMNGGQVLSISSFLSDDPNSPKPASVTTSSTPIPVSLPFRVRNNTHSSEYSSPASSTRPLSSSSSNRSRPGFTNFPAASIRRKGREAGLTTTVSVDSTFLEQLGPRGLGLDRSQSAQATPGHSVSGSQSHSQQRSISMSESATGTTTTATPVNEYVYQHRDAGAVRELPPPYADRGNPRREGDESEEEDEDEDLR